ncbi:MAG: MBL fold metallo-hydrolase, partial [Saprospiraceae bacterium]|nr:MBL fold metallo-hydrolase [Saprospiraceae bacterium]
WAMRCLLVETDDRKILIDTGIGTKQNNKFRSHFEPTGLEGLSSNLKKLGVELDDITDVFLTHLHFDHCGAAVAQNTEGVLFPTFKNARYWSNQKHWAWAKKPNPREAASFLTENFLPLELHDVLQFIDYQEDISQSTPFLLNFDVHFSYGHTEAMMLPRLKIGDKTLVFCADTMPSQWHIGMPYVMAYDIRPLDSLREKEWLLNTAVTEGWYLFFEHDPVAECGTVKRDERGRIVLDKIVKLSEVF